ncbi:hypothetical protein TPE_0227 [Treponema pedis str. T A4]|uniref:Uncharacterized protein n=1 Tax=Treponema pedis str. T A4 TaxID=1291379 RepID=S5ZXJ5_9SPIR|nr:hypothetical protein TPE_0227 [Treponema pedis str. T A4]
MYNIVNEERFGVFKDYLSLFYNNLCVKTLNIYKYPIRPFLIGNP